jgi:hypothetical protein
VSGETDTIAHNALDQVIEHIAEHLRRCQNEQHEARNTYIVEGQLNLQIRCQLVHVFAKLALAANILRLRRRWWRRSG